MTNILRVAAVALVLPLAGCSPYSFSKEISAMSDSVNKLSDAYSGSFSAIAAERAAQTQAQAVSMRATGQKPQILMAGACLDDLAKANDPPCVLYVKGEGEPHWTTAEIDRKPAGTALKALRDYAAALAGVTNAQDRSAYDTAVGQLSGAVGTLLAPANLAAPGVSAAVSAGINVFGWLVGTALDEQRFDTLRIAVAAVGKPLPPDDDPARSKSVCYDPELESKPAPRAPIRIVTDGLCWNVETLASQQRTVLRSRALALLNGLNDGTWGNKPYAKALADAQAAFASLEALRRATLGAAANALADAHDKLVKAVEDPKKNYNALVKAIGDFVDKVSAVEAALKQMAPTKQGS
jgi:hypothetical protein